jgi:DNA-binding NarL/FixJ family response regulator
MRRVVVAEDHPLFRDGLAALLDACDDLSVVATTDTVAGLVNRAAQVEADIVLLDLGLSDGSSLAAIGPLCELGARVLVLTAADDDAAVYAALRSGAHGYLLKSSSPNAVLRAVHTVADGAGVYDGAVVDRIAGLLSSGGRRVPRLFPELTAREYEILALMAEGRSNAEIADHFVLALKTVRNHVSAILAKLGVATRAQAIVSARDAGLGTPGPAQDSR